MSTGIGDALRGAREEQGRGLQDAARVLRVRTDYLLALEEERFDTFGGDVYAKGFLRSYAVELGLDPEPLLEAYRREVSESEASPTELVSTGAASGASPRKAPPAWIAWVAVVTVALVGLGVLGLLGDRTPETASPDENDEAPPSDGENQDDEGGGEDEPEPDPEPESDPEPEPAIEGVDLMLAFEEASWLRVVVDGTPLVEETVDSGETRQFEADSEIEIRFGNAGGVRIEHNGEDIGSPGSRGEPLTVTFREDEVEGVDA